jgi:Tol biopolymer transport system component
VATAVLTWIDRSGNVLRRAGTPGTFAGFRISPDAQSVVADRVGDLGARSVWVYDAEGSPRTRVTFAGGDDWQPIWAPDGRRVAFMSYRDGPGDIYVKDIASAQPDEPLLKSEEQKVPADWSADGKYLAYAVDRAETRQDVWVLPLEPRGNPIEIARTTANEARPRFSPDGRWIAYDSDETGRPEVYVQPFPPTGGKWQVSTQGGRLPVWRGRELFFIDARETLVTVPVTTVGSTFSSGAASSLFKMSNPAGSATNMYDADPDGRTFLVRMLIDPPAQSIVVMLNWPARLRNQ